MRRDQSPAPEPLRSSPAAARDEVVAVVGATGYVGGRLIPELLARGFQVRALARRPAKLLGRGFATDPSLSVARADVLDAASLDRALVGVDVAYYLVHSLGTGADFAERDELAAKTFGAACRRAGVQRIVYLSGLGQEEDPNLSEHLASRHGTGDALAACGVPVTELRAGIVVGSGSASFEIIQDLVHKLPIIIAPKWLRSRCEPISIRDVVEYLVRVIDEPRTVGEVLEIGSGEQLTYQRMLEICGDELGRRPTIIPVPLLTPGLSSWWLHLVTSVDHRVARPLVDGLRNDTIVTDRRIQEWIPIELADYRTAVRRALVRAREPIRWSSWRDALAVSRPTLTRARYSFSDARAFDTDLPPEEVFTRLGRIGGEHGYGIGVDSLWRIRGWMDRAVGGPGLRR